MAFINLVVGGTGRGVNPNCNGERDFGPPWAHRIANEYATGFFTLGYPLSPSESHNQQYKLDEVQVGDIILMYGVPAEHTLVDVVFKVTGAESKDSNGAAIAGPWVGAQLKPTAVRHSVDANGKDVYTVVSALDEFTAADLGRDSVQRRAIEVAEGGVFVEPNTTLLLGWSVLALPTNTEFKLSGLMAIVSLASHVIGYDIPSNV